MCIEIDGFASWTSQATASPQEILRDWIAEDFLALRAEDETKVANRCFECEKWYCSDHAPWNRIVDGAPAYDYYFSRVCPQGHECIVER